MVPKIKSWLKKSGWLIPIWLIIAVGILLRIWNFGSVPVSLYWDEMAIWDDALSVAKTGHDLHGRSAFQPLFISYGDYKLPTYIWLTIPFAWLTYNPLIGARVVSLLAGLSMIPAVWLLVKQFKLPRIVSWLASAAMAILPWSMHFSRVGFEGHLGSALVLWSVVLLLKWRRPPDKLINKFWLTTVTWLVSVLAFYAYFSVRFVWPVLFFSLFVLWWREMWSSRVWLTVIMAGWLLAMIPMLRADFYQESNKLRLSAQSVLRDDDRQHQANLMSLRAGNSRVSHLIFSQTTLLIRDLAINYTEHFDPEYLFDTGDENLRHGNGFTGLTWWVTAPFIVVGLAALWKKQKRILVFLTIWWLVGLLPAAVPREVPHALRSLNALPVLPMLTALGVYYVWKNLKPWLGRTVVVLTFLILSFEVMSYAWHYFRIYPALSAEKWQDGYHQLAEYLAESNDEVDEVIVMIKDDRLFLYYLPVSGLDWADIQTTPTIAFKHYHLENIWFEPEAIPDVVNPDSHTRIIVPVAKSQEIQAESNKKEVEIIYGQFGVPRFTVYE